MSNGGWLYIQTAPTAPSMSAQQRILPGAWEHRAGVVDSFTKKYGLQRLVYAERYDDILSAKQRERNMKHWPRAWKVRLILKENPTWDDLYDGLS